MSNEMENVNKDIEIIKSNFIVLKCNNKKFHGSIKQKI